MLTGATGSLGAHILQQLVSLPSISRVICFSRAKSHADSLARLQESLVIRRLTLSPEEWTKVESFAANVNEDRLGLSPGVYLNLLSEVTAVIHVSDLDVNENRISLQCTHSECLAGELQYERRLV